MIKHQQILPHAKHEPETWVKNQKQKKEEIKSECRCCTLKNVK